MKIQITEAILQKAKTYMPIAEKQELSKTIAEKVVVASENKEPHIIPIPTVYIEDVALKPILMMNTFIGFYLDIEMQGDGNPFEKYDDLVMSDIFGQLEYYKKDVSFRWKINQMLDDYRAFEKMVNSEIFNIKQTKNDTLSRLSAALGVYLTPENIEKLTRELKAAIPELQNSSDAK